MVRDIEHVGAELQMPPLAQRKFADERGIEIPEFLAAQRVAAKIAERERSRDGECSLVEPLGWRRIGNRWIAHHVQSLVGTAGAGIRDFAGNHEVIWKPRSRGENTVQLPVAQRMVQRLAAGPERAELVHPTG